jgi:hypothetical protein
MPNWAAVQKRLDQERKTALPETDTSKAVQQFGLAWEAARTAGLATNTSGLIEQQARFSLLRDSLKSK